MEQNDDSRSTSNGAGKWGVGLAMGVAIGTAIGVAMNDIATGIGVGLTMGVAFALLFGHQPQQRGDGSMLDEGGDGPADGGGGD